MNNSIEYWTLLNEYFLNEYSGFCFELNLNSINLRPDSMKKRNFQNVSPGASFVANLRTFKCKISWPKISDV